MNHNGQRLINKIGQFLCPVSFGTNVVNGDETIDYRLEANLNTRRRRRRIWLEIWAPLGVAISIPLLCWVSYQSALHHQQVVPFFPLVSDVGGLYPQSIFFSNLLDIVAILVYLTARYRSMMINNFIEQLLHSLSIESQSSLVIVDNVRLIRKLNQFSNKIVISISIGAVIMGNFRSSECMTGHMVGVVMTFLGMLHYVLINLFLCIQLARFKLESSPNSMSAIVSITFLSLLGFIGFQLVATWQVSPSQMFCTEFRLHWSPDQPGYLTHSIGSILEWITIHTIGLFYVCLFNRARVYNNNQRQGQSDLEESQPYHNIDLTNFETN